MPPAIARLPRSREGYPIPWFVAYLDDGTRDFRIAGQEQHFNARRFGLCWICGQKLGRFMAFVLGPMCAVNRVTAEPPNHRDCAVYAAKVCPFLATPSMCRRDGGTPDGLVAAAGETISRNPGASLVWVTREFKAFRAQLGNEGVLFDVGEPVETSWWAEGRPATRAEVMASIRSGLPILEAACESDDDPAESLRMLDKQYHEALALVPGEGQQSGGEPR
jgi:hypothetical protein